MYIDDQINETIRIEGGYVNNPFDKGGETNFGITKSVAIANGFYGNMRDLTKAEAFAIYKKMYWFSPNFDDVETISPKIAYELFDTGVNCGTHFASTSLQRALNLVNLDQSLFKDLIIDGKVGNNTISCLSIYLKSRKEAEDIMLKILNILQGQRYIDICEKNKTQERFINGWIAHRIKL